MLVTRLRQVVVAAADRDATESALRTELGLGAGFHDPGVAEFGLDNAVCPVADVFVEVVSPKTDGSPGSGAASSAGRHIARNGGDCGYMVIFQVEDIGSARSHLDSVGIRRIWNADLPDISGSHAHPSDIGGAIVSFDQPRPASGWLWGGPDWPGRSTGTATGFSRIEFADPDPEALARRWSRGLNIAPAAPGVLSLDLPDGVRIDFRKPDSTGRVGLVGVGLRAQGEPRVADIAGVTFTVSA